MIPGVLSTNVHVLFLFFVVFSIEEGTVPTVVPQLPALESAGKLCTKDVPSGSIFYEKTLKKTVDHFLNS